MRRPGNSAVLALSMLLAAVLLSACGSREEPLPPPPSRPVKLFTVAAGDSSSVRTFPGKVNATQRADLSFRVPGRLKELLVKEGDLVAEDQVLARLDPTDYEIVVGDRQASFDNASRNFQRGEELVKDGNISRIDYDRMEAEFKTAFSALSKAQQDLEYTVLRAPFKGRIAQRYVEKFEEVAAKETVMSLQNIDVLDVVINVPESVIRSVQSYRRGNGSVAESDVVSHITAYAEFEGHPDAHFPLQPKELATRADEETQTFRATFTMRAPKEFNVLPGMTANVVLDLSAAIAHPTEARWVPARAVQGDEKLQPRVWVLDPATMTVSSHPVQVGRMAGSAIEVTGGLSGGEEIVAVGAPYLAEGMRVTRMPLSEQAEPRADEPDLD
jgi:RND family efflux transporter MFP subunit